MLLRGGQKMGKSLGNAIQLGVLHEHFSNDMIRYFLLREVAFGQDGEVTYEALIDRVNSDLADGLGNLASRTLTMIRNYFDGVVPRPREGSDSIQEDVPDFINTARSRFDSEFEALNFSRSLEAAWSGIARVDKFITDRQPWKLAKDPSSRSELESVLATAFEGLRHVVLLVAPVLPDATKNIWTQMGLAGEPLSTNPVEATWGENIAVTNIGEIKPSFPKLLKEKIMSEIDKESGAPQPIVTEAPKEAAAPQPKPAESPASSDEASKYIGIEDFTKVELRSATVLEAERIPKADKLLRLVVDLGEEQPRQILAGIAQYYSPEDMVGRKIVVVANLAPRKMRGLESNGMLLAASVGDEGRPVLATFGEEVPNGTRLK